MRTSKTKKSQSPKIQTSITCLSYGKKGTPMVRDESLRTTAALNLALHRIKDENLKMRAEEKLWQAIFNDPSEKVIRKAYDALGIQPNHAADLVSFNRMIDKF
jgi:histone deacetylase complex regulatory component SIN3